MEKKPTFEEAYKKLEEASTKLEKTDITLEEAIKSYEEGIKYYNECKSILETAKGKVAMIEEQEEFHER